MKKLHLILAFVSSLLATVVWAEPADINAADGSTLVDVMVGVGLTRTTVGVDYRAAFGVLESVSELVKVNGIGVAMIEKNRISMWERVPQGTLSSHVLVIGIRQS